MIFKKTVFAFLFSSISFTVGASNDDASVEFFPTIIKVEKILQVDEKCDYALSRSWHTFSGTSHYEHFEKVHIDGALLATECGLRRGWFIRVMLDELKILAKNGFLKKNGREAAIIEAQNRFMDIPRLKLEEFTKSLNCTASTPRISFSRYYENVVSVTCSSNKGPVKVDLASMRIQVGGQDVWNGPSRDFFGRSMSEVLKGL